MTALVFPREIPAQRKRLGVGGMPAHVLALGRMKSGDLNKTEEAYREHLVLRHAAGEIVWFKFEPWSLRLADNTFYKPDFGVMLTGGAIECHEVKGFWRDDAKVKIKVAAEIHPFRFIAVKAIPKRVMVAEGLWRTSREPGAGGRGGRAMIQWLFYPFRRVVAWFRRRHELLRRDILASVQRQPNCSPGHVWYEVSRSRWNLSLTIAMVILDRLADEGLVAVQAVPSLSRPGETHKVYSLTPSGVADLQTPLSDTGDAA